MHKSNFETLQHYLESQIIGQHDLVKQLLIALLADGHILVEGPPGLAKTRAVKSLSDCVEGDFHRIQFTPDLLPADLTGTDIFRPETGEFTFQSGPIFNSLILADEINRAPAKVQAALLEAMAEGTITVGDKTHVLPDLFMVLATQNPVEQEGTYPLPEAQMDRFIMKVTVDYPEDDAERDIIRLVRSEELGAETSSEIVTPKHIEPDVVLEARRQLPNIVVSDLVDNYIVALVMATRKPERYADSNLAKWIEIGSSPRASIALDKCARAYAWMQGRDHVTPDDVRAMVPSVLGHRFSLTYDALADGVDHQRVVQELLDCVEIG